MAELRELVIKELKKLLKDPDKRIRLRAISLILRYHLSKDSNQPHPDFIDEESKMLDELFKELERKSKKTSKDI